MGDPFYILSVDGLMRETGAGMFIKSTIRDVTFDGQSDAIIDAAMYNDLGLPVTYDKFGWYYPVQRFYKITISLNTDLYYGAVHKLR